MKSSFGHVKTIAVARLRPRVTSGCDAECNGRLASDLVEARRLRPPRVDDLVDHVDGAIVGLDVALVARAGGRRLDGAEGIVKEVLAKHAAVGDLAALDRGEVGAGERARADLTLDDVIRATILRQFPVNRCILRASLVARGEDGDARLIEVDAVL